MKTTQLWSALVLGAALTLSGVARAQTEGQVQGDVETDDRTGVAKRETVTLGGSATGFGTPGQIVLSQDFSGAVGFETTGDDQFFINLAPAADYFLMQNLSVGLSPSLGLAIGEGNDIFNLGLAARLGFNLPVQESISFWPRVSMGFIRTQLSTPSGDVSDTNFAIGVFAPALVHLNNGFFVGAGPEVLAVPGEGNGVTLQLRTTLGGYF